MSETIVIAIIGVVGAVLAGAIGAFATIEAAKIKAKSETGNTESGGSSCTIVGLVASVTSIVGLALGAMFATMLLQQFSDHGQVQATSEPTSIVVISPQSTLSLIVPSPTPIPVQPTVSTPIPSDIPTQPPESSTTSGGVTRHEIDAIFGVNNWICFGNGYYDASQGNPSQNNFWIGIKHLSKDTSIVFPIEQICSRYGCSSTVAQGGTGASAKLSNTYYISANQCPDWQQNALIAWRNNRNSDTSRPNFSQGFITQLVGSNWECNNNTYTVAVTLDQDLYVGYPITFVTGDSSLRDYGVGETVPAGTQVIVWIDGSVSGCT